MQKLTFLNKLNLHKYPKAEIIQKLANTIDVNIHNEKFLKRFEKIKKQKIGKIFETAKWNLDVFKWALKSIMDKNNEKLKQKKIKKIRFKISQQEVLQENIHVCLLY
eukprot:TRINITY_DN8290_c0_g1_i1.p2 TRINITY_DN8290_c0_g1~~TRINITY_DN8290_c0_g1_i1.p2  ORF type:complete len:107 (-),score=22.75 TRINITY_DN8290_c0_g1_i1:211-531(-)